ncbi:hypothetical protein [Neobacillus niacini]|uniref:hypothetical protein n=1 Tax=Neobacillus niacini TaxID=86668 RepID=UPI0005F03717|nr:hypothetical protein [Neobacillus niacini]
MVETKGIEKNITSLELLWNHAFQNLDDWVEREKIREDNLLKTTKLFAENVKRNQSNLKELVNQFSKELFDWEKTSREELLTATISLQTFFPIKSYEEINDNLDTIHNKSSEIISSPFTNLAKSEYADQYVAAIEKFIEFRRNNRNWYIKNVKETASIIQTNQNKFLKIISKQVRNVFLPFNRYIEQSNELTK